MFKKLILLTMILSLTAGTSYAGTLLTENEMDEVSASGLQIITNDNESFAPIVDQDNNLDSVQLNDYAQASATTWSIINSAKSAVNEAANILIDGYRTPPPPPQPPAPEKSFSGIFDQTNENAALNHVNSADDIDFEEEVAIAINLNKETQVIINGLHTGENGETGGVIEDQDNNNNSVQLNNSAQSSAKAFNLVNSSTSAANVSMNLFVAGSVNGATGTQTNIQIASNMSNYAESGYKKGLSIAANVEAQVDVEAEVDLEDNEIDIDVKKDVKPRNTQTIMNTYEDGKEIIWDQDNNNNSVQLNDSAQYSATADSILNTAQSAVNISSNIASVMHNSVLGSVSGLTLNQYNHNEAYNHVNVAIATGEDSLAIAGNLNKETQFVSNMDGFLSPDEDLGEIVKQDNNNNSVQLNDSAQYLATAVVIENLSMSASNTAINIMKMGDVSSSSLSQVNEQYASNYENYASSGGSAIAANAELLSKKFVDSPGQYIHNVHAIIYDQDNNNNSVQLNDNAQAHAKADKIVNAANSAVNVGENWMVLGDIDGTEIEQANIQHAGNHNNSATASDWAIAANINKQTQIVKNCFCSDVRNQDNNMNSVQLNDYAQYAVDAVAVINAAESAINSGLNVIYAGTISGGTITQYNNNTAINFSNTASGTHAIAGNAEIVPFPFKLK